MEVDRTLGILHTTQKMSDALGGVLVDLALDRNPAIAAGAA